MESSPDKLTPLQRDVLKAFFELEQGFFLTGGAAIAGFHLKHRETSDLDLFTSDGPAFERGRYVLQSVGHALHGELIAVQEAPGFLRQILKRGDESVVVDLVWDRVPQAYPDKEIIGGIRVDRIEEILVNKLTTVLSRAEERDLVDLYFLERAGYRFESALAAALQKDGACTPATLAWLLSQVEIPDAVSLPAGCSPAELRSFVDDLVRRLRQAAAP